MSDSVRKPWAIVPPNGVPLSRALHQMDELMVFRDIGEAIMRSGLQSSSLTPISSPFFLSSSARVIDSLLINESLGLAVAFT